MKKQKPKADFLLETSFEVCNKAGGIYRVLESKTQQMLEQYGEGYYLIGPYNIENSKGEFKQRAPDDKLQKIFDELEKEGIKCYFGEWMVEGRPKTILIDYQDYFDQLNNIKNQLWESFGVDSLKATDSFNEPIVWAWAAGQLIEKLNQDFFESSKGVAHFHEWLSGAALLYLKDKKIDISSVFTTHATFLGRTLANHNVELYDKLEDINPEESAYDLGINAKHQLEKTTAKQADIFTTVSKITSIETENLLGKSPDVVLPNGLNLDNYLTFEEIVIKHRHQRRRLREFIIPFFFPYYKFDIENTLFYFIVGRYEHKVKGVDVFIKSLAQLNEKLKNDPNNDRNIVTFFWLPTEVKSLNRQLVENKQFFQDIQDSLGKAMPQVKERILYHLLYDDETSIDSLLEDENLEELNQKLMRLDREESSPPLCTHELPGGGNRVIKELKEHGLTNQKEDQVKVIYYPIYLTGHDGLSNLTYNEALEACHLGVFPSFYEPWGYTPLEAAALGVASVTTDLAGFGQYRQSLDVGGEEAGVYTLQRHQRSDQKAVKDLAKYMYKFSQFNRQSRVDNKIKSRKIAAEADWEEFVNKYVQAHNQAL